MTCKKCDEYNEGQHGIAYYRWGTANIGLLGCPEHVKQIIEVLNENQKNY